MRNFQVSFDLQSVPRMVRSLEKSLLLQGHWQARVLRLWSRSTEWEGDGSRGQTFSSLMGHPADIKLESQITNLLEKGESESRSVESDFLWPHELYSPWNSPGQNTGVGSLSLLQGNLPNPGIEPTSPALQADSLPAEPQGNKVNQN